eukprot:366445-Chlamydomonas_euryale.AAC.17
MAPKTCSPPPSKGFAPVPGGARNVRYIRREQAACALLRGVGSGGGGGLTARRARLLRSATVRMTTAGRGHMAAWEHGG